jgi:CheY-like chemotaxis protein
VYLLIDTQIGGIDMPDKQKILVVDDNALLRTSLVPQLSGQGYDVRQASSGNDAIPMLHGGAYDLILLDLKMPYIDGFEVLKFVKGTFPNIKVVVVTAYADLTNVQKCRKLGADDVIGKPYNLEYLFKTIERVLKRKVGKEPLPSVTP